MKKNALKTLLFTILTASIAVVGFAFSPISALADTTGAEATTPDPAVCEHTETEGRTYEFNGQSGEWKTHKVICSCGEVIVESENCSGGTATCQQKAVCDYCDSAYGSYDITNHVTKPAEDGTLASEYCNNDGCGRRIADATLRIDSGATVYYADLRDAFKAADGHTATINLLRQYVTPAQATSTNAPLFTITSGNVEFKTSYYNFILSNTGNSEVAYSSIFEVTGGKFVFHGGNGTGNTITNTDEYTAHTIFKVSGNAEAWVNYIDCTFPYYVETFLYSSSSNLAAMQLTSVTFDHAHTDPTVLRKAAHITNGDSVYIDATISVTQNPETFCGVYCEGASADLTFNGGEYASVFMDNAALRNLKRNNVLTVYAVGYAPFSKDTNTLLSKSDVVVTEAGQQMNNIYFDTCTHTSDVYGTQITDGSETHNTYCFICAKALEERANEACSGGTATCIEKAQCEVCGGGHGDLDPENHVTEGHTYLTNGDGTHSVTCACTAELPAENCTGGVANCGSGPLCDVCGGEYGEKDLSNHVSNISYLPNDDGTHNEVCAGCELASGETLPCVASETYFSLGNDYHSKECVDCGDFVGEALPCDGGAATCIETATCDVCGVGYGEFAACTPSSKYNYSVREENGIYIQYHYKHCTLCNTLIDETKEDCHGGTATCMAKAKCDVCETWYGDYAAHQPGSDYHYGFRTENGIYIQYHYQVCTLCGVSVDETQADCSGGEATCTEYAICDVCNNDYGDFNYTNHSTTERTFEAYPNGDGTHTWGCVACDQPNAALTFECSSGEATCYEPAFCPDCDYYYGDADPTNHKVDSNGNFVMNSDGTCFYCDENMAQAEVFFNHSTERRYYLTLEEAFEASNGYEAIITLLQDYVIPEPTSAQEYLFSIDSGYIYLVTNGYSISSMDNEHGFTAYSTIFQLNGGVLDVIGSSPWSFSGGNLATHLFYLQGEDAFLLLDGVELSINTNVSQTINIHTGALELYDVTFEYLYPYAKDFIVVNANDGYAAFLNVSMTSAATDVKMISVKTFIPDHIQLCDGEYTVLLANEGADSFDLTDILCDGFVFAGEPTREEYENGKLLASVSVVICDHIDTEKIVVCDDAWNEHFYNCAACGLTSDSGEACTGGTATCSTQATCEICNTLYGEKDENVHANVEYVPVENEESVVLGHLPVCIDCEYYNVEDLEPCFGTPTCIDASCEVCGFEYTELDPTNHTSEETYIHSDYNGAHEILRDCCNEPVETVDCTYPEGADGTDGVTECTVCGAVNLTAARKEAWAKFEEAMDAVLAQADTNIYLDTSFNFANDVMTIGKYFHDCIYDYAYSVEDVNELTNQALAFLQIMPAYSEVESLINMTMVNSSEDSVYAAWRLYETLDIEYLYEFFFSGDADENTLAAKTLAIEKAIEYVNRFHNIMRAFDGMENIIVTTSNWYLAEEIPIKNLYARELFGANYESILNFMDYLTWGIWDPDAEWATDDHSVLVNEAIDEMDFNFDVWETILPYLVKLPELAYVKNNNGLTNAYDYILREYFDTAQTYEHILMGAFGDVAELDLEEIKANLLVILEMNCDVHFNLFSFNDRDDLSTEDKNLLTTLWAYLPQFGMIDADSLVSAPDVYMALIESIKLYKEDFQAMLTLVNETAGMTAEEKSEYKKALTIEVLNALNFIYRAPEENPDLFDPCSIDLHRFGAWTSDWTMHKAYCERCNGAWREGAHEFGNDAVCDVCDFAHVAGVKEAVVDENGHLILTLDDGTVVDAGIAVGPKGDKGDAGEDGKDGVDGTDGKDGKDGIDGTDGTDGKDGIDGIDGANGENGSNGADGREVEFRTENGLLQWRYVGDEEWTTVFNLDALKSETEATGCASVIVTPIAMLTLLAAGGAIFLRKREE